MKVSTIRLVVEFPTRAGFAIVKSDYPGRDASLSAAVEESNIQEIVWEPILGDTPKEHKFIINPEYPYQSIIIGADLPPWLEPYGQFNTRLGSQTPSWSRKAIVLGDLKIFLADLPTFKALIPRETLTMYLAAFQEAIGSMLLADRKKVQISIYFFSKMHKSTTLH
ncbi:hypothetical protein Tco_0400152 [Tanacetum coccineum]